ncbi:MarR family transcriptional regulator [Calidifontibacter sp. DB0510]|uniref:MarR family transcriptional regulator n=1 Tax=Metallococcus carri TaxID=1656884 RepID=A0A967B3T8_9MICO|nr:MarR family transcriptional regulator [Metallococcus carri]NOP39103.1 MarR family transcriptional regulator [Calidifontibacter sp. DB2511S]
MSAELDEWLAAIPGEVDARVEAVRQRIGRIARQFDRVLAVVAAEHDLSIGDWEALSALARAGAADGLTPGQIGERLALTSGTVSVRLERLRSAGLVEDVPGADGRQRPVRLTPTGMQRWGAATLARTQVESRLFGDALTPDQLGRLDGLLARLLAGLEDEFGPAPRHDMTRGRRSAP